MKRLFIAGIMLATGLLTTMAFGAAQKVEQPESCAVCGMSRPHFAQSRMLITFENGSTFGTCSIACASGELAKKDKKVKSVQVGDYATKKLIDARSATWVINKNKRGIMSSFATWAFAKKEGAEAYIKQNGGTLATWDEALAAAHAEKSGTTGAEKKQDAAQKECCCEKGKK